MVLTCVCVRCWSCFSVRVASKKYMTHPARNGVYHYLGEFLQDVSRWHDIIQVATSSVHFGILVAMSRSCIGLSSKWFWDELGAICRLASGLTNRGFLSQPFSLGQEYMMDSPIYKVCTLDHLISSFILCFCVYLVVGVLPTTGVTNFAWWGEVERPLNILSDFVGTCAGRSPELRDFAPCPLELTKIPWFSYRGHVAEDRRSMEFPEHVATEALLVFCWSFCSTMGLMSGGWRRIFSLRCI